MESSRRGGKGVMTSQRPINLTGIEELSTHEH